MSGMTQLPDHVTHVLGWTLIHFLWQGTAVAALLAVANATICSRRVDLRYGLACTGMVLLVLLPTITAWAIGQTAETGPRPAPPALFADAFGGRSEPLVPLMEKADSDAVNWPISARTVEEYLPWAVHLWMVGAALFLFRMAGGWTHLQSLRRFSRPMGDGQWQRIVWAHGRRLGMHAVPLLESTRIAVPSVVGWLRPAILVPIGLFAGMAPRHIEAILLHELAHIRRGDGLVNVLQALTESVLFFHPAVWWVSHRIRIEREFCCDDAVVSTFGDSRTYARALSIVGERRNDMLAVAANSGGLLARIHRLLRTESRRLPGDWVAPLVAFSLALAVLAITLPSLQVHVEESLIGTASRLKVEPGDILSLTRPLGERLGSDIATDSLPTWQSAVLAEISPSDTLHPGPAQGVSEATPVFSPTIPARVSSVADPPREKIWPRSDPRFWIGEYEGTADIHRYRVNPTWPDSNTVREQLLEDRGFTVRIRRPVLISGNPDNLAANADIVVNFGTLREGWVRERFERLHTERGYGNRCSSFLVDLDLSSRIDGKFRGSWPGPENVRARMNKKGDRLVGTFKPYCRDWHARSDSLDSPALPMAEYRFDVRKRKLGNVESTSRLLLRSASVD